MACENLSGFLVNCEQKLLQAKCSILIANNVELSLVIIYCYSFACYGTHKSFRVIIIELTMKYYFCLSPNSTFPTSKYLMLILLDLLLPSFVHSCICPFFCLFICSFVHWLISFFLIFLDEVRGL